MLTLRLDRQEGGDDDDLGMSAAEVLRSIRGGMTYITFPDCDATVFAQLCDALRESTGVTNLRVMVDKQEQAPHLARVLRETKVLSAKITKVNFVSLVCLYCA